MSEGAQLYLTYRMIWPTPMVIHNTIALKAYQCTVSATASVLLALSRVVQSRNTGNEPRASEMNRKIPLMYEVLPFAECFSGTVKVRHSLNWMVMRMQI